MNIYSLFILVSVLVCLFTAEVVYHSNRKETLNRVFVFYNLASAYYLFIYFMCAQSQDSHVAYFWSKGYIPGLISVALILHFILVFTEKQRWLKAKVTYFLLYFFPVFYTYLDLGTEMIYVIPHCSILGLWC
jgi:hypothetical protein